MAVTVTACVPFQTELGEGVRWDARRDELLWVDILGATLFRQRVPDEGPLPDVARHQLDRPLGAVAPVAGDDGWLVAAGRGFARLGLDSRLTVLAEPVAEGSRVNDALVDPAGRFWAGSMAEDQRPGAGTVEVLDRDGTVNRALEGLTIPNGMDWSPDASTMYLADSGQGLVFAFEFDAARGRLGARRTLIDFSGDSGVADGLTVDADGDLWTALHGAGEVRRYAPDGRRLQTIRIPAPQTTSPGFAGTDLGTLFVATATEGYSDERRRAEPLSGRLFRIDGTGATGVAARPFEPVGSWWPKPGEDSGGARSAHA